MRFALLGLLLLSSIAQAAESFSIWADVTDNDWDCPDLRTADDGTTNVAVQPGDTIYLRARTSGSSTWVARTGTLHFKDCRGTAEAPIIFRNHPDDLGPVRFSQSAAADNDEAIKWTSSEHFTLDGTGGWTGMDSGAYCGAPDGRTGCGIEIIPVAGNLPVMWIHLNGMVLADDRAEAYPGMKGITVKGVKIDGQAPYDPALNSGVGIYTHDVNTSNLNTYPGALREDITIEGNYFAWVNGEAIYSGNNSSTSDACTSAGGCVPQHNIKLNDNLIEDCGRDCINLKMTWTGTNEINGNVISRSGLHNETGQSPCINTEGSLMSIVGNVMTDCGGNGLSIQIRSTDPAAAAGPWPVAVYNNVIDTTGVTDSNNVRKNAIQFVGVAGRVLLAPTIYNNTLVASGGTNDPITLDQISEPTVRNNIIAQATACDAGDGVDCSTISNETGAAVNEDNIGEAIDDVLFVGPEDFRLQDGSPAIDVADTAPFSATDILGVARPQGAEADAGAYEYQTPVPPVHSPIRVMRGIVQ